MVMAQKSTPFLFVYGTLMSASSHPMAVWLRRNARLIGPATITGKLYDFGQYPGATLSTNVRDKIYGEIFRLTAPAHVLPMLDNYEGATPHHPRPYFYIRRVVEARLETGRRLPAWIYVVLRVNAKQTPIADGRYLPQGGKE